MTNSDPARATVMQVFGADAPRSGPPAERPVRSAASAIGRGLRLRCPACGEGALFAGYLKVNPHCPSCGEALHHHRADDFPPYIVIVIVGHIVVPLLLSVEKAFRPDLWIHLAVFLPLTALLSLALLPPVKGAVIGLQWAMRMHGFDPDARDPALPDLGPDGPAPRTPA
jgi:uncharacterized protein (DUF983 family)